MKELTIDQTRLQLLPDKAIYLEDLGALLVSDVHLGKAETFQHHGFPVPSQVNQVTLDRLQQLCHQVQADSLWILGDLFHSQAGLTDGVIDQWLRFLAITQVTAHLIVGNHDRPLNDTLSQLSLTCWVEAVAMDAVLLSHEPVPNPDQLNICGHIHPCLRLSLGCDRLRLPCFHWQARQNRLTLPAFGEFTGGYDIRLRPGDVAYGVVEGDIVSFSG